MNKLTNYYTLSIMSIQLINLFKIVDNILPKVDYL